MKFRPICILPLLLLFLLNPSFSQIQPSIQQQSKNINRINNEEKLALHYYRNKEYEKAAELYEILYKKNLTQYHYTYYMHCLLKIRDFKKAEKLAGKQIKKNPTRLKYHVDLGYIYQLAGKPALSKKEYDAAIRKLLPDAYQVKDLANAFYIRAQIEYAVETYLLGQKLLRGKHTFHFELANLYKVNGNYGKMIDEYLAELEDNPESMDRIQNRLQAVINEDLEGSISNYLWKALLKKSQRNPDNIEFSEMLLWFSIQKHDFEFALVQAKSLDRRFDENGQRVYELARLCISNRAYDHAIDAFNYIIKKGEEKPFYLSSVIGQLNARYLKIISGLFYQKSDLAMLEKDYITTVEAFGKTPETITMIRDLAHLQAFYLDKQDEAIEMLKSALKISYVSPKTISECKIELADIFLFSGEVWEATLLYSQVEKAFKHEPIGHLAKFKNARLTYYIGEFEWAKAQLDVLKAATSKLIANDAMRLSLLIGDNLDADSAMNGLRLFSKADLLSYQNKDDLALKTLDSIYLISLYHTLFDDILFKKAGIKIKNKQYTEVDSLLQQLVSNYPYEILADDALFMRAELQEIYFQNQNTAMELYQQLLLNYPGSLYTVEARKRFRRLRGDDI